MTEPKYPEDFKDWKSLYLLHNNRYLVIESPGGRLRAEMSITERVLAYLKEQPGSPDEIAEALGLTKRGLLGYRWGGWSFSAAESGGLIVWKDGKWHLKGEG